MIEEAIRAAVTAALAPLIERLDRIERQSERLAQQQSPQKLSPKAFAEATGLSLCSVYRHVADNRIPHTRVGSRLLIDAAALQVDEIENARRAREARG